MTPPIHVGLAQHPIKSGPGARFLARVKCFTLSIKGKTLTTL